MSRPDGSEVDAMTGALLPALKVVADANMPQVSEIFAGLGDVCLKDGRTLTAADIADADVLLVRSVTSVTLDLLAQSSVKFVGSATAGLDHIDPRVIDHPSIGFANAAGANARSVVEYDLAALSYLYRTQSLDFLSARIGVVGYGNVGRRLCQQLDTLGIDYCVYDPFVYKIPEQRRAAALAQLQDVDILCVHAPLTTSGPHPTLNMIDARFLSGLKDGAVIVSAGRGGVVDEAALMPLLADSRLIYCADVWQGEPMIDQELLNTVAIGTPHIAGYSTDSKVAATQMLFDAACQFLEVTVNANDRAVEHRLAITVDEVSAPAALVNAVLQAFPISEDDESLRRAASGEFDQLRAHYWQRREFTNFDVSLVAKGAEREAQKSLLLKAGFSVVD